MKFCSPARPQISMRGALCGALWEEGKNFLVVWES